MKRNIAYLIGLIFVGTMFIGCDNDDEQEYSDLTLDTEQLVIDLDKSTEGSIKIVKGNGNYKLSLSNDNVATVTVEDNIIRITGVEPGKTELTITDWAKKTTKAAIVVKRLEELILTDSDLSLLAGEIKATSVYVGNGGYTISSSNEAVAKGSIDETGNMTIEGIERGTATFTVTDGMGKSATMEVKVKRPLLLSQTKDVPIIFLGESVEINILDGNGGYKFSKYSTSYLNVSLDVAGNKIVIKGLRYGKANTTLRVEDEEGSYVEFKVILVDDPYLNNIGMRYAINENDILHASASAVGSVVNSPEFKLNQLYVKTSTSTAASGFGVRFSGDLTVGSKSGATWFKITRGAIDENTEAQATDLRIDKVESGFYWVSFMTEGKTSRSYIVVKQS